MGVLLLPYTMSKVGPLCTVLLLASGCLVSYASLRICCAGMHAARAESYGDTLLALFSERFAVVLTLMLVVATFGQCSGYMVFASQLIQQLMRVYGMPVALCDRSVIISFAACLVVFPLSLFRNLSDLRYLTLISLSGLACLTMVVICRTPRYFNSDSFEEGWWWRVPDVWAVPKCFSLCFSSYVVHMNVFTCYGELQNPTPDRMNKVLIRAAWVETLLYMSVSICGYLSFGTGTPDNILWAYDLEDSWANLGRFFVSFQLLLAIPVNVHPARIYTWSFVSMLWGPCQDKRSDFEGDGSIVPVFVVQRNKLQLAAPVEGAPDVAPGTLRSGRRMPLQAHLALTALIVALSSLVAAQVSSASDLLGIVGGFAAVTYAFLLPAEMARQLRRAPVVHAVDWGSSPATFVRGPLGKYVVAVLRACSALGYVAAAQCAWGMLAGSAL